MPEPWVEPLRPGRTSRPRDCISLISTLKDSGRAGFEVVVALDDRLVDPGAALHVVGLDGEQFLQGVGGAVGFERPDFHFPEALAAVLGLAAERLLGDERVGADGAGVDLVGDQVAEFEDVDDADDDRVVEGLAGAAVIEGGLAAGGAVLAVADPGEAAAFGFVGLALAELRRCRRRVLTPSTFLASDMKSQMSSSLMPSKIGVATLKPRALAATPRWVSSTWPTFMRDGTPSGLRQISTGVPSSRKGMSSSGTMVATTPLLPWRPAILSPTESLRLAAMNTFTSLMTPGSTSSPVSSESSLRSRSVSSSGKRPSKELMISRILLRIGRGIDLDVIVDGGQLAQQGLGDLAVGRDDDLAGLGVDHVERDLLA